MEVLEMALQVCLVCLVTMTHIKDGCEQILMLGDRKPAPPPYKFNRLIGSKNFSCFSKRSEMKSTLPSAPNASASITSCSISEVADAPDEIQYNLSFVPFWNGLMKPTIASATFTTFVSVARSCVAGNHMEVLEVAVQVCLVCLVIMTHIKDGCEQPMKEYRL
jgi:hypothetical protein